MGARIDVEDLIGQVRIADLLYRGGIELAAPEHSGPGECRRAVSPWRAKRVVLDVPQNLAQRLVEAGVRAGRARGVAVQRVSLGSAPGRPGSVRAVRASSRVEKPCRGRGG